jgi:hypothetical protein
MPNHGSIQDRKGKAKRKSQLKQQEPRKYLL